MLFGVVCWRKDLEYLTFTIIKVQGHWIKRDTHIGQGGEHR